MGIRQQVQKEMAQTGLPEDLMREFHDLSQWAGTLPATFGSQVELRVIDAASIEGFFKSLVRRFRRFPAFSVGDRRYVGTDFEQVNALIAERLQRGKAHV